MSINLECLWQFLNSICIIGTSMKARIYILQIRLNKYIKQIYFMHKQSQSISNHIIQILDIQLWKKIAQKNIQKMVPTNVEKMNVYTFQSLAQLNSSQLQGKDYVNFVQDKKSLGKDNFLHNYIAIEKQPLNSIKNMPTNLQTKTSQQKVQFGIKRKSLLNNNSMISTSKQQSKSPKTKDDSKFISLDSETYQSNEERKKNKAYQNSSDQTFKKIQGLRNKILFIEQAKIKQQNQAKILEHKRMERHQAMMKKKKQMQKFTFDYDGQFFGSKNPNPENTLGSAARVKSQCNKDPIKPEGAKLQKIKPAFTKLINQKLQQRYKRIKSQNQETQSFSNFYKQTSAARFANSLVNDDSMSEGVSIRQTTSNFFKQKPLNRIGGKLTLTEFKRQLTDKRFKQFRVKPVQTNRYKKKIMSYKSEQNFVENRKNTLEAELSQKKSEPADINVNRKKRYMTLFDSEHSMLLSNSKVSDASNKFKSKGFVKISNPSLFSSVFDESDPI